MKKHLFEILYIFVLIVFTVYVVLDSFVITRVYKNPNIGSTSAVTDATVDKGEVVQTETSYSDKNISVTISEYRYEGSTLYVADVKIASAEYLKTALANNSYGKNVVAKTSETAKNNNAIFAVNGDYYGAREKGYVLRNGVLYRDTVASSQEDLVIYKDGSFEVITEKKVSAQELVDKGAEQILSFGPALLLDGKVAITKDEEYGKAIQDNPRTAIGIIDELHYLFVVADGRTVESKGVTIRELANFMMDFNVVTAYNLDGGGSSAMYFNGNLVNNPSTSGTIRERKVSDIVYIGY